MLTLSLVVLFIACLALALDFVFPTSAELTEIAQEKMPRLEQDRPIFRLLPTQEADAPLLMWEQRDNYRGLQQLRGLDGAPHHVQRVGLSRYQMQPGYYGEFINLDETELTLRRQTGTFGTPVDITTLVLEAQDQLLQRRLDRIELIGWTVLQGTFSVAGLNGIVHTDAYSVQTYNATTWATAATATPLADFRAVQLLSRGRSVNFGRGATAFMNRGTANALLGNTNDADLYGKRTSGLANLLSMAELNQLEAKEDLPALEVYDEGYLDDAGVFQLFIPNGTVIVTGQRPAGQVMGEYRFTRNVNNPDMRPGPYMKVIDRGETQVPRRVEIHDGHNGGPVLFFPGAIVVMDVS